MFIVSLTYLVPVDQVEAHMAAHLAWLDRHYEAGRFIASGRKVPRTGGVIMARGTRTELEACMQEDPFVVHKLADYQVIEFAPSRTVQGLEALAD